MEILCSYLEHFAGIIDVVHIRVVEVQMWTELVEASAEVAILQMDQQRSAKKKKQVRYNQIQKHRTRAEQLILHQKSRFEIIFHILIFI